MADRIVVASLARTAKGSISSVRVCPDLLAELCRAWLALDAAPEGKVKEVGGSLVMIGELSEPYRATAHPVRLVATSGGE